MIKALVFCMIALCFHGQRVGLRALPFNEPVSSIPILNIIGDTSANPMEISFMKVDVNVMANIATTTFEITFFNPNDKVLEGELEFPLNDGQHIVGYALDIDGRLRDGVVVEKAKGRIAFESTIRRKIDPGLVEKTKGNNFKTRVYPLPAKGNRRVRISVEEILPYIDNSITYSLPLRSPRTLGEVKVVATVTKSSVKPIVGAGFPGMNFSVLGSAWKAEMYERTFVPDKTLSIKIPFSPADEDIVLTEDHEGITYFYLNSRLSPEFKEQKAPSSIAILWDISASSEKRNVDKEIQLLEDYFRYYKNMSVTLIPFNIRMLDRESFSISGGNSGELLKRLRSFDYDGGTQLGALDLSNINAEEILLFSDGLSTFGNADAKLSRVPVITISSSPSADHSYLKFLAQETNGKSIDLNKSELSMAIEQLTHGSLEVVDIDYSPNEIDGLVSQLSPIENSGLSIAGKLKGEQAIIRVSLGFGKEITKTKEYTIQKQGSTEHVKRVWAEMQIEGLDLRYERNKEEITKLGKEFSVVTRNTSLIVLDQVQDYVLHEITPPAELRAEYDVLMKEKIANDALNKDAAIDEALVIMDELKEWWNTEYTAATSKYKQPIMPPVDTIMAVDSMGMIVDTSVAEYEQTASPYRGNNYVRLDSVQVTADGRARRMSLPANVSIGYDTVPVYNIDDPSKINNLVITRYMMAFSEVDSSGPLIRLKNWNSNAPYLKVLQNASTDNLIKTYYSLKKQYASQPSFFMDVAQFFISKNDKSFALQVLSNIAEMKLENAELLRMMGNVLLEMNENELAIETFKELTRIRKEDPLSFRDLAMAYHDAGNYDEAVSNLYKIITGDWDSRFDGVKAIAITEMNSIVSSRPSVNPSFIDKRLIYAMPMDVRVVISWNADNSDIDLWVTDPRNEKCFYQHQRTEIGGKISEDITQGFGPEEFCLRKARTGSYKIEANLFGDNRETLGGPITIRAELYTNYGRANQQKKIINFRVKEAKEVVTIGNLQF